MNSELLLHLPKKVIPTVCLNKYPGTPEFSVVKITSEDGPIVSFFIDELVDIIAFKNNILRAFEKYIKEQTS